MYRNRTTWLIVASAVLMMGIAQGASAQESVQQDPWVGSMRELVAQGGAADRDLETVRAFLAHADVRDAARSHGLEPDDLSRRVEASSDAVVADLAQRIREKTEQGELVGGDTLVISTTAVIIVLLVLILVAVD